MSLPDSGSGTHRIFPSVPALARQETDGTVTLVEMRTGWTSTIEGPLATEVAELLRTGSAPPRLAALASVHPAIGNLLAWLGEPSLPLTPAAALRQGGFGTLFLELLGRCNERCVHCYAGSNPELEGALDQGLCEAVIDDAAELGFERVQLTGGDPLLCKFLPALANRAAERGIPGREIYTNGLLLSDRLLDRLEPAAPAFAFSFYSHDAATHDAITRVPGSQKATAAAIARALARGFSVRAAVVVMEQNAGHLAETVAYLRGMGVGSVSATPSFAVGRGDRYRAEVEPYAGDAHRGAGPDDGGRRGKLCVTYDGHVVPCIFNREHRLGNVRHRRLLDIASAPMLDRRPLRTLEDTLRSCEERLQCSSCRLTACALELDTSPRSQPCAPVPVPA